MEVRLLIVFFPKLEKLLARQNGQQGLYVCMSSLDSATYLSVGINGFGVATFSMRPHIRLPHRLLNTVRPSFVR